MENGKRKTVSLGVRCPQSLLTNLDIIAHRLNINRTALVNLILSEYVNERINKIQGDRNDRPA